MHKAIIVEDELHSREFLKKILNDYCPELKLVALASNVEEGVAAVREHHPDIIFLDIEMQTGTGFDLLEQFPDPDFEVIFTTAYDHYAIRAIKFSAMDYLLKPIEIEELQKAVGKITGKQQQSFSARSIQSLLHNLKAPGSAARSITLPTSEGLEFIPLEEIIRIEASGPYSTFFLKHKKKIMVSRHLKEYELMLTDHGFFRIHNSHIINIREVLRMVKTDGGYVVMSDEAQIGISMKKKNDFMEQMRQRLV